MIHPLLAPLAPLPLSFTMHGAANCSVICNSYSPHTAQEPLSGPPKNFVERNQNRTIKTKCSSLLQGASLTVSGLSTIKHNDGAVRAAVKGRLSKQLSCELVFNIIYIFSSCRCCYRISSHHLWTLVFSFTPVVGPQHFGTTLTLLHIILSPPSHHSPLFSASTLPNLLSPPCRGSVRTPARRSSLLFCTRSCSST